MPAAAYQSWDYPAPIPADVVIGDGVWLYSTVAFIHHRSTRRPSVKIGNAVGMYGGYFDLGPGGEVRIGDCVAFGAVISTNGAVTIGDYTFLAYGSVLADREDAVPPPSRDRLEPDPREGRPITIGENVWVGTRATVLGGSEIGDDAIVGARTVVDGMRVPAGAIVAGNPARIVGSADPSRTT